MKQQPGVAYLCGPHALRNALQFAGVTGSSLKAIHAYRSPQGGVTLGQVAELAKQVGQPWRPVYRESAATVPVPSVIHWKLNHYAAVIGFDGKYYHIKDPTFGDDLWVTPEALRAEASGFFWFLPPRQWSAAGAWQAQRN